MSDSTPAKTDITAKDIHGLNPSLPPERAALYAKVLSENAWPRAVLNSPRRICNFLGQTGEETGGFTSLVESTAYRNDEKNVIFLANTFSNVHGPDHARRLLAEGKEAIGNTIYAYKNGNGGPDSGDGYRFRGRGFLQITGRENYRKIGLLMNLPLEAQPELLENPSTAAQSAAAYWSAHKINDPADVDDVPMVTRLVNGSGLLHLAQRKAWHDAARKIWVF